MAPDVQVLSVTDQYYGWETAPIQYLHCSWRERGKEEYKLIFWSLTNQGAYKN